MAGEIVSDPNKAVQVPVVELPHGFHISSQDHRLGGGHTRSKETAAPPLGVLDHFTGIFTGTGFNLIFRPNSGQTTFPNPLDPKNPPAPNPPNENVLELNLTTESLSFSKSLGEVPNRGLEKQSDIFLNGVPYVQSINDVTNTATGKADAPPQNIHYEPGLWMHVPETKTDPVVGESLSRMASIPHGTTINAQGLAPTSSVSGPPPFTGTNALPPVDITPFTISKPVQKIRFASQTATATNTPRLPQDLSKFIAAGTITQEILDNPNLILAKAIEGQHITNTIVFAVATTPKVPFLAGGTANIDFLQGSNVGVQSGPNASAAEMESTFWIETVEATIKVPVFKQGDAPVFVKVPRPNPAAQDGPTFKVQPPHDITTPKTIKVTYTQIQYMQNVSLNFATLTWPHVSCATLIPSAPITVPDSAFQ